MTGLGFDAPITARLLEQVIEFYREQGAQSVKLQIAPQVLPAGWEDLRAKLNIPDPDSSMVKLAGHLDIVIANSLAVARLDGGLRLGPVPAGRVREWAEITWEVFDLPAEHQIDMCVAAAGQPGWQLFAVYEGDAMVATAILHTDKTIGHLFGGATLPRARNRGAQSALIAARAVAAREAGCTWLMGETGAEQPGEHNSSLNNMVRAGLALRYERKNWTWRPPGTEGQGRSLG